jgi:signal peptidase I
MGGPLSLIWVSGISMEPTLSTGDLAVLYQQDHYSVGDVVAFEIPEGGTVIHRVIRADTDGYQFRGDNRDHDDPWTLDETWIRGRQVVSIPRAAHVMSLLGQPRVMAALVAAVVVLARLNRGERKPRPA